MKADTGASRHYIKSIEKHLLSKHKTCKQAFVTLPNKIVMKAEAQVTLPLPNLPPSATTQALILPQLTNIFPLSIGQLCDKNCIAVFNK